MTTYPATTPARCNRCDQKFPLPKDVQGEDVQRVAMRLQGFCTCPHCGRMDTHWIYTSDLVAEGCIMEVAMEVA